MNRVHIDCGGPTRKIIDATGQCRLFEDHPQCGPIVLDCAEGILAPQPGEDDPFWEAVSLWYAQGKRINDRDECQWDYPTMQFYQQIGRRKYILVDDVNKADLIIGGNPQARPVRHGGKKA